MFRTVCVCRLQFPRSQRAALWLALARDLGSSFATPRWLVEETPKHHSVTTPPEAAAARGGPERKVRLGVALKSCHAGCQYSIRKMGETTVCICRSESIPGLSVDRRTFCLIYRFSPLLQWRTPSAVLCPYSTAVRSSDDCVDSWTFTTCAQTHLGHDLLSFMASRKSHAKPPPPQNKDRAHRTQQVDRLLPSLLSLAPARS